MKKTILFLALIFILTQTAKTQINWSDYSFSHGRKLSGKDSPVGMIIAINEANETFNVDVIKGNESTYKFLLGVPFFLKNHSGNLIVCTTFDSTKVQFFLGGVTKYNIHDYEYLMIKDADNKNVSWTKITNFGSEVSPKDTIIKSLAYIGGFTTKIGHRITVDVRKKGTSKIISTAVVFWGRNVPQLDNIYLPNKSSEFLKRLNKFDSIHISKEEIIKWNNTHLHDSIISLTRFPGKLKVASSQNNLLFSFSAVVVKKDQIEYELLKDHRTIRSWKSNESGNEIIWLKDLKPGTYVLRYRYRLQPNQTETYPFVIMAPWYQTHKKLIVTYIFILVLLAFIVFLILLYQQKQKAKQELAKKEKLQLELKAIYAQLNPHFVFNALSSIQGLINKNDIEGANMYLSDFASLMRDTMTNNNKEQTSLNEELITLETYLKLEQLRFGFKFEIKTNDVNIYETEIPSLLLQPLIENAVKHGVSSLKEEGFVNLLFSKANNDMVVEIKDNGEGFVINEVENGYGLKLTRDRIKLLNQIMNGQSIELYIKGNTPSGTIVSLQFKNWFL
jgi:hypothetical protein